MSSVRSKQIQTFSLIQFTRLMNKFCKIAAGKENIYLIKNIQRDKIIK